MIYGFCRITNDGPNKLYTRTSLVKKVSQKIQRQSQASERVKSIHIKREVEIFTNTHSKLWNDSVLNRTYVVTYTLNKIP